MFYYPDITCSTPWQFLSVPVAFNHLFYGSFLTYSWLMLNGSFSPCSTWFGLCTFETGVMKGCWSQMHEDLSHNYFCSCVITFLRGLGEYTYKSFDGQSSDTLSGLSNQKMSRPVSSSWEDNCLHGGLMNSMHILVWPSINESVSLLSLSSLYRKIVFLYQTLILGYKKYKKL